jgi:hypothetical protein
MDGFTDTALTLWRALALGIVRELAASQRAFSTDDLWSRLDALPKPPEPRALGAVMTTARAQGFVAKSPFVVISQRPECHTRPVAVWLSVPLAGTFLDGSAYVAARSRDVGMPLFGPHDPTAPTAKETSNATSSVSA